MIPWQLRDRGSVAAVGSAGGGGGGSGQEGANSSRAGELSQPDRVDHGLPLATENYLIQSEVYGITYRSQEMSLTP